MILEGIANFRDIGGIKASHGSIRAGRVFRSGYLGGATFRDLKQLRALCIGTVIDLRRPSERMRAPTRDFGAELITSDLDRRGEAPHTAFLREGDTSAAAIDAYLLDYYRRAPFEAHNIALFGAMFIALARSDRPLLVHCTAGKDRTGLAIAILLSALGSSADDIIADFSRSNIVLLDGVAVATARSVLARTLRKPPSGAMLRAFLGVDARHLGAALETIEGTMGITACLELLGGQGEQLEQIRKRLIM